MTEKTQEELEIQEKIQEFIKSIAPEGKTLWINECRWIDVEITCGGSDSLMGYHCCLEPNHKGQCYSNEKKVDFTDLSKYDNT
jgi:hypothetical protein